MYLAYIDKGNKQKAGGLAMVQKTNYETVGYNRKGKHMWAYTLVPPLSKYVWSLPR